MESVCEAIPPSPMWSDLSLDLDNECDVERYKVIMTVTELYYVLMGVMISLTCFICTDDGFDISDSDGYLCRFLSILNAMRSWLKGKGDLHDFKFQNYKLKRMIRRHRARCNCEVIHKQTGKCSSNLIMSTLLHAHRDTIDDYEFLMTHLANQRNEEYMYWRDRRETAARNAYMGRLKRYDKVFKYNLNTRRKFQDLWNCESDTEYNDESDGAY